MPSRRLPTAPTFRSRFGRSPGGRGFNPHHRWKEDVPTGAWWGRGGSHIPGHTPGTPDPLPPPGPAIPPTPGAIPGEEPPGWEGAEEAAEEEEGITLEPIGEEEPPPGGLEDQPTDPAGEDVPSVDDPEEEEDPDGVLTDLPPGPEDLDDEDPDVFTDDEEEANREREERERERDEDLTPEEQEAESKRRLDEEFQNLLDEHEGGWENIEDQLQSDTAEHMRRIAEINAQMGRSVGGGFGGAYGQVALGSIEAMANAKAKHETEKRNLQLAWMEKSIDQDFQREMAASDQAMSMITALLESGEEIDPETLDFLFSQIGGGMGGGMPSQWQSDPDSDNDGISDAEEAARGSDPDDAESMPEEGDVWKNEEGDLYYGVGEEGDSELGVPGEMAGDPYDDDGEDHQWFASGSGAPWDRTYYYTDDDGNRVEFVPGEDGGRYPGDPSYYANDDYSMQATYNDEEGEYEFKSPSSSRHITYDRIYTKVAEAMASMFGIAYAGTVTVDGGEPEFANEQAEAFWNQLMNSGSNLVPASQLAIPDNPTGQGGFVEITSYILAYMDENEGAEPSGPELAEHLEKMGWV